MLTDDEIFECCGVFDLAERSKSVHDALLTMGRAIEREVRRRTLKEIADWVNSESEGEMSGWAAHIERFDEI